MKLRGIEYGNVLGASGVQGFFGEGYWFHELLKMFKLLNMDGMTFVSKTATLYERAGNMPLETDLMPIEMFPQCIEVRPFDKIMLNAVGLSNPGINVLLKKEIWQNFDKPFLISIMLIEDTPEKRIVELRLIINMLKAWLPKFKAPFCLQINESCPNVKGHDMPSITEAEEHLKIAAELGVPLMPKFSIASAPYELVAQLEENPYCDAICVSNTVPYAWNGIGKQYWKRDDSPLQEKFGVGRGISGKVLRPLVCKWISNLRRIGFTKQINGGGGILEADDVYAYHAVGASSIFLGSVVALRPWQVKRIINCANSLSWGN